MMKLNNLKLIFNKIKIQIITFSIPRTNNEVKVWYNQLKNYNSEDVLNALNQAFIENDAKTMEKLRKMPIMTTVEITKTYLSEKENKYGQEVLDFMKKNKFYNNEETIEFMLNDPMNSLKAVADSEPYINWSNENLTTKDKGD